VWIVAENLPLMTTTHLTSVGSVTSIDSAERDTTAMMGVVRSGLSHLAGTMMPCRRETPFGGHASG
jgi:hypothetical protein